MIFAPRNAHLFCALMLMLGGSCIVASGASGQSTSDDTKKLSGQSTSSSVTKKKKGGNKLTPLAAKLPVHAHDFVVARGLELWRGNYEFTNIGVNIPDLFVRFLNNKDSDAIATMQHAAKAGVRFVRCEGCTRSPQEFHRFLSNSAGWLAAFQRMLAAADDLGISIVPVLLPDIRMVPAYLSTNTIAPHDSSIGDYLSRDTTANRLAIQYIDAVVDRFKGDPRVLFWEVGEEYNLEADLPTASGSRSEAECFSSDQVRSFLIQIASHIKAIDGNHLISSGNADMRPNSWHLRQAMLARRSAANKWTYPVDDSQDQFSQYSEMITFFSPPGIDIVSVHESPPGELQVGWLVEDDDHALRLPWSQQAAGSVPAEAAGNPAGKPIFIGEFGQPFVLNSKALPIAWTLDFVRRIRNGPSSVCALNLWETGDSDPRSASIDRTPDLATLISTANLALLTADLAAPFNK